MKTQFNNTNATVVCVVLAIACATCVMTLKSYLEYRVITACIEKGGYRNQAWSNDRGLCVIP